ncbi:MAG: ATP-binding protein [Cryomorphaceae bacterium]|jgi:AAA+ superfamily predicted ATPase|nr:ATP-binding protein [Cryomorphaceae bacterium]
MSNTPTRRTTKTKSLSVMDAISSIYKKSKQSGLKPSILRSLKPELKIVSEYISGTEEEGFLFANIATMNLFGEHIDMLDIFRYFDITPFEITPYLKPLNKLVERGVFTKRRQRRRSSEEAMRKYYYSVHGDILDALLNSQPFPARENGVMADQIEVLGKLYDLSNECIQDSLDPDEMFTEMEELLKNNRHFPLISAIRDMEIRETDRAIYIYVVWKSMNGSILIDIDDPINSFLKVPSMKIKYLQEIYNGENKLIKHNLVEYNQGRFFNDIELSVTDKTRDLLESHGITLLKPKNKSNTIKPENITSKQLFYEKEENEQIDKVLSMMEPSKYTDLMSRLESKGLPQNLNILLFGAPGTGKTETVLQLAKLSGREIIKVDISQSKSMWFGESEKLVKKIFKDYESISKNCKLAPILLFNEADAILATRKNNTSSSVAQTENAIQNILLEELENFKGIFIATTNLAENLDKAFDRRFLFKVRFNKPSVASRAAIWRTKIPSLKKAEATKVAERFELTGGQIDNVVRKAEIEFVLNGKKITVEKIIEFCLQESVLQSKSVRIGFGQAS